MPGASGASSSPAAGASASGARARARSPRAAGRRAAAAPARRGRRRWSIRRRPASRRRRSMRSMRPRRSASTCAGRGRRDVAGAVGRGRHHRAAEGRQNIARHGVRRARAPRCCRARRSPDRRPDSPAALAAPASAAPARTRRRAAPRRHRSGRAAARRQIRDMGDQRIEGRPAFGGVEPRDGLAVGRVGAEPVDGLGREGDQAAGGEARAPRRRSLRHRPSLRG